MVVLDAWCSTTVAAVLVDAVGMVAAVAAAVAVAAVDPSSLWRDRIKTDARVSTWLIRGRETKWPKTPTRTPLAVILRTYV